MDLTIYDIIKGPRITQKAIRLNQVYKQLVVDVHPQANKPMIVDALKKLFGVEVERIRVSISKGKRRRSGRHITVGVRKKKAIVTLKEGYSMDLTKMSTDTAVKAE
jgi:large subunit ribosomal protein L23